MKVCILLALLYSMTKQQKQIKAIKNKIRLNRLASTLYNINTEVNLLARKAQIRKYFYVKK